MHPITINTLPKDIIQIIIKYIFDIEVTYLNLPASYLKGFYQDYRIDVRKHHEIDHTTFKNLLYMVDNVSYIHKDVYEIQFTCCFNEPVVLPSGLKYVRFGKRFNQPIVLPQGIHTVEFGNAFNQPIELPQGIDSVHFSIDNAFNQPIELPEGLHTIEFGNVFNQPIALPEGLHTIEFGNAFNQPVKLPEGIHTVEFGNAFSAFW